MKKNKKYHWLAGLLGSDAALFFYFLTLFKLKKVVPAEDYREMRAVWLGCVLPAALMVISVLVLGVNNQSQIVCKFLATLASAWLIFSMFRLKSSGYVVRHMFKPGGRGRGTLAALGLFFFAVGLYLLLTPSFLGGYELVSYMLAAMLGFMTSGLLLRFALIKNQGDENGRNK